MAFVAGDPSADRALAMIRELKDWLQETGEFGLE
jgi:hypothetical protein